MATLLTPTPVQLPAPREPKPAPPVRSRGTATARRIAEVLSGPLSTILGSRAAGTLGILTYHRVVPQVAGMPEPTWNVTPAQFRAQLEGLLGRGYRPMALRTALELDRAGSPVPSKTFVVTFDDGYENVYLHAWPILKELGIPATIFLATAYIDSQEPFPFDDWSAAGDAGVSVESWRPLTTQQCREMLADGLIELGSHTHTHENFRDRPEELRQDLQASLDMMRSRFGLDDVTFSWPYGISEPRLIETARESGVLCALTRDDVLVNPKSDPFDWGRFEPTQADTAKTLRGKLDGWYSSFRGMWLAARGKVSRNARAEAPSSLIQRAWRLARPGSSSIVLKGIASLMDQGVVSGVSFLTVVLIGRVGSQQELGLYYLALNLIVLIRDAQCNLTTAPYSVYCNHRKDKSLWSYTGSTLVHQLILAALAAMGLVVLAGRLGAGYGPAEVGPVLLMAAAAAPFILTNRLMRDFSLTRLEVGTTLAFDSAVSYLQALGLLMLIIWGVMTAQSVFLVIGAASALGCLGWFTLRRPKMSFAKSDVVADWRQNWHFGRWAVSSQMLGCAATYAMPWIVAFAHGEASTGLLAACVTVVNFAGTFVSGMANFILPKATRTYAHEGLDALQRVLIGAAALFITTLGAFFLVMLLGGEWLATSVFGPRYIGAGPILALLSLNVLASALGMVAGWGLWAVHRPRANFSADAAMLTVTLILTACLVGPLGVKGAAIATLSGMCVATTIRICILVRVFALLRLEARAA